MCVCVCVCVRARHPTSLASLGWGGGGGAGWPITLIVTCIMSWGGGGGDGQIKLIITCIMSWGGGDGQIKLIITCVIVSWVGGWGGFRYPITDLPPPNDVHNLQSLQGARRKLTSQFDYYLHLDIVTPREREKLSLLQQTNVTISTCKSADSKQCSTQHLGHVRTLVYGSVYKTGYQ